MPQINYDNNTDYHTKAKTTGAPRYLDMLDAIYKEPIAYFSGVATTYEQNLAVKQVPFEDDKIII